MRDLLPKEVNIRDWATRIIVETYGSYGFHRIETPCLESIELLKRGEGGENLQLIYEILKRGDKLEKALKERDELTGDEKQRSELSDLGLRFDLTVPLVRYYASNMNDLPTPFKSLQVGSVWRAEAPQQGRYRQFTQCDIDIIGIKGPFAELELIGATAEALERLGFEKFTVRINDRRILQALAASCGFEPGQHNSVFIAVDKLDKIGLNGVIAELERGEFASTAVERLRNFLEPIMLELKDTAGDGMQMLTNLKESLEGLDEAAFNELRDLIEAIKEYAEDRFRIAFDPTLVRGMGYYTGPIFEVSVPGYTSSVAGGGRYDKMLEKFLGREIPACGFSIGFERVVSILEQEGRGTPEAKDKLALIYDPKRDELKPVSQALKKLRREFQEVSLLPKKKDLKKQIDQLPELKFSAFCLFRGDAENLEIKRLGDTP